VLGLPAIIITIITTTYTIFIAFHCCIHSLPHSLTPGDEKVVNTREVGILQYLGLDDWKVALPVAMCFAPPLIHHEVRSISSRLPSSHTFL
jgi:hypothetical protein